MNLQDIVTEAASIAAGIEASKSRAMIYQADAKERMAARHGKPADAYFDLPYDQWAELQAAHYSQQEVNS